MNKTRRTTFDPTTQETLPDHIKEKEKADLESEGLKELWEYIYKRPKNKTAKNKK